MTIQTASIPATTNAWLIAGIVAVHVLMLAMLPYLLAQSLWWATLIPALAWVNNTHWALIHEGIHKLLHPTQNEPLSRLLGILMGTSFHVLRFGHLMHHQMNRDWQSEWVRERSLGARLHYYTHLLVGLYGSEVLSSLAMALLPKTTLLRLMRSHMLKDYPQVVTAGERFFYTRRNIGAVRVDMTLSLMLYTAAFIHFGAFWPVLLGFIAMRALAISLLDNIYHYATPADNSKAGKELLLPPTLSALVLHGNYHETHHLNPDVPWTELPATHANQGRRFDGDFLEHGLRQFHGPLLSRA